MFFLCAKTVAGPKQSPLSILLSTQTKLQRRVAIVSTTSLSVSPALATFGSAEIFSPAVSTASFFYGLAPLGRKILNGQTPLSNVTCPTDANEMERRSLSIVRETSRRLEERHGLGTWSPLPDLAAGCQSVQPNRFSNMTPLGD